jgi:hypothetical protein
MPATAVNILRMRKRGISVLRLLALFLTSLEYWIARSSRATTAKHVVLNFVCGAFGA